MKIISKGQKPHKHETPSEAQRQRMGLEKGSVIECECGVQLRLIENYYDDLVWIDTRSLVPKERHE